MNTLRLIGTNIVSIGIIILFIHEMYLKVYGKLAAEYIRNQLNVLSAGSIGTLITLVIYYYLEARYKIDEKYLQGIGLTIALLIGGLSIEKLYDKYFKLKKSKYVASDTEYLFQIIISFIAVSIVLLADGTMENILVPVALVAGRLVWLDTKSLQVIWKSVFVEHNRIIESSVLYIVGMLIIALCPIVLHLEMWSRIYLAMFYGLIIRFVYGNFRKKFRTN